MFECEVIRFDGDRITTAFSLYDWSRNKINAGKAIRQRLVRVLVRLKKEAQKKELHLCATLC